MTVASSQPVFRADHRQLAKQVFQTLPPQRKGRDDLIKITSQSVCNKSGRFPFEIYSANYVCLIWGKHRQKHVKTVADQRFKLIVAN
ncbi:hypothetical protein LCGC14_1400560 [marine sediment metagenome]|uniref:Uncharacterized protein n=1 Tax=marine sediment metagenome TaxID=412755 RepID=A0A0F9MYT1_9ZZZZ